ncbi:hypothetical protein [Nocardioides gansuensis]|nr:hypothetical protein [Nocardioides gansuensis]
MGVEQDGLEALDGPVLLALAVVGDGVVEDVEDALLRPRTG